MLDINIVVVMEKNTVFETKMCLQNVQRQYISKLKGINRILSKKN